MNYPTQNREDKGPKPQFIIRLDDARLDAGETVFLSRQLEHIMAEVFEVDLAPLRFLEMVPIDTSVPVGAARVTYRQLNRIGSAIIGNQPNSEVPRVDIFMEEFSSPVHEIQVAYGYSVKELEEAQFGGVPLDREKADTARRAVAEQASSTGIDGNTNLNLNGLLLDANIPTGAVPTGTWSGATADQILADMSDTVSDVMVQSKGTLIPDSMVMPLAQFNRITDLRVGDTGETVLSFFLRTNPHINSIEWLEEFNQASIQGGGATNVLWVYKKDPRVLRYVMPLPFTQLPIQEKNFELIINCRETTGGLIVPKPLGMKLASGI